MTPDGPPGGAPRGDPPRGAMHGGRPRVGDLPVDEEVSRELESHLALRAEELEAEGWDPQAARAEAARRFGDYDSIRQDCASLARRRDRRIRRSHGWEAGMQDVRYAIRSLVRSPGFAVVALLTLALGIGANTAIYGVVHGVLLRPLPYDQPERIVTVAERGRQGGTMSVAWPNLRDWREQSSSFEAMAAYGSGTRTVLGGLEPIRIRSTGVSQDFWQVMRTRPVAGRVTAPEEHSLGAPLSVVIAEGLAERLFGAEAAVGRTVEVRGVSAVVVGVIDAQSAYPQGSELWYPVEISAQGESRTAHNWSVVARLADDITLERARDELGALTERMLAGEPADDADYLAAGVHVTELRTAIVGDVSRPLLLLLGAAACVLLVACTNLASTLLARGTARAGELAVRSSLGADRGRLVRQLLTENAVLAGVGAVLGTGVAALLLQVIRGVGAEVPRIEGVALSLPVLGFTVAIAVLTVLASGLLPALRLTERSRAGTLRGRSRGSSGDRRRIWGVLVATEVALAVVLLMGSGLLVRSFARVLSQNAGFEAGDVAMSSVALNALRYPEAEDHARFYADLLPQLEALQGVEAAGILSNLPLSGGVPGGRVQIDGDPDKHIDAPAYIVASPGTFEALDIPLLRGRLFDDSDGPEAPEVVVVNEAFVAAFWPDRDPIGGLVSGGGMDDRWSVEPTPFGTVVGVVGDVRYRDLTTEGEPTVYWNFEQRPFRIGFGATVLLEAEGDDAAAVAPVLRRTLTDADADIAVEIELMADRVAGSVADRRFMLLVLGGFAALALILAAVGIYGVVSYTVARRTREMGIRLALGAEPESVRGLVLGGAMRTVVVGVAAGLCGAIAVNRLLESFLFDVAPWDPLTFAAVPLLLLATAFLASWVPARRSTRVDPVRAMRAE